MSSNYFSNLYQPPAQAALSNKMNPIAQAFGGSQSSMAPAPATRSVDPNAFRSVVPTTTAPLVKTQVKAPAAPLAPVATGQTPAKPPAQTLRQLGLNSDAEVGSDEASNFLLAQHVTPQVANPTGTIGTQHPGDPGFNTGLPVNPTNTNHSQSSLNVPQAPVAPQEAPINPSFSGLVGNMVNQQNSPYNTAARNSIAGLAGTAQTNPGTSGKAYDDYNTAVKNLQDLKSGIAATQGGIESQAIPLEFQQGREQALNRQYASQLDAGQQAVNQYQQQIQNQIAGTQTQQSGFNSAAGNALTGQGQVNTALSNAAGLAKGSPASYGQTVFNPLTGSFDGGGNLDPQTQSSTFAQNVLNGTMTYDQAAQSMGYAGSAGKTFLDNAITAAGGNPLQLQASGSANQSNIQTAGTAETNTYNGIYNTASTAAANYSQQQAAINSVGNQALQILASNPSLNSTNSQYFNAKLNQLSTQFSSTQYTALNTAIQSLQARIGKALQAGEIPTAATGNAQAIASGNLTVGGLAAALKQVDDEMSGFVKTQNDLANYAKSKLNAPPAADSNGNTSGKSNTPTGGNAIYSDKSFFGS
jgi:hypothetical protein